MRRGWIKSGFGLNGPAGHFPDRNPGFAKVTFELGSVWRRLQVLAVNSSGLSAAAIRMVDAAFENGAIQAIDGLSVDHFKVRNADIDDATIQSA